MDYIAVRRSLNEEKISHKYGYKTCLEGMHYITSDRSYVFAMPAAPPSIKF